MQRKLTGQRISEDEEIKAAGLTLDFDEIAKRGAISKEEALVAKWYGLYGSRQPGNLMARIVVPGGVLTSQQARRIAQTAEHHAQARLNITTRQSVQYHWLKLGRVPDMLRELAADEITTFHGCGDVNRNTTACAMAENCVHARINVRPYARETARVLATARDLDNLPRKLKIVWSGCPGACAQPYMNCLGMTAVECDIGGRQKTGFQAVIGGGMGWKGFVARELFAFVPTVCAVPLARAVALLFRDHGDRFNRSKARLKFVVERLGIGRCRELVLAYLRQEGVATAGLLVGPLPDSGTPVPDRPLTDSRMTSADGSAVVRIRVPKGEMTSRQFAALAELSDRYADQRLYTTNRQNIELHGIDPTKHPAVEQAVHDIGFPADGVEGLRDMVACVGTTYCPKAVATTRELYDLLEPVVSRPEYAAIDERVRLNITGCPNACSPYRIVDIGFRGMRIREVRGSVEGWEMVLGGDQRAHGQKLGDFKTADCAAATAAVLDTFLVLRHGDETLGDCIGRVGMEPFARQVFNPAPPVPTAGDPS